MAETHIGKNLGSIIQKELLTVEKSLLISSPAISLSIGEKIFEIVKKGIKVRVITSEKGGADSEKTNQLAIKLLNVEKNEIFKNLLDYKIVEQNKARLIHPKIYVIDDKCAIVGSANLTENGFYNFVEFIQLFKEKDQVKIIKNDFEKLWKLY